ncbi:MAG: hypothetical protein IKD08_02210, partial [Alphaproteobacteria bacterium]|nr:hypothetical protein [Alphaproteobacteria bacterium]
NEILVTKCKVGSGTYNKNACVVGFKDAVNKSCQNVYDALEKSGLTIPASGSYSLTSDALGNAATRTCYFDKTNKKGYEGYQVIEGCNAGTAGTCALGYNNSLNRTCQQVIDTYKNGGKTPVNGNFRLPTSATAQTLTPCWFKNTTGYSTKEVIEKCNAGTSIACQIGRENKLNRTCAELQTSMKSYGTTPTNGSFKLTLSSTSGSSYTCDMSQTPPWTQVLLSGTEGASYTAPYKGTYGFACAGGAGDSHIRTVGGNGGIVSGSGEFSAGSIFKIAIKQGGLEWGSNSFESGGRGIGIYLGSSYALTNLKIVAGGGGGAYGDAGGSVWGGGGGANSIAGGFGFYANAQGTVGKAGGGSGSCPTYAGSPYGGKGGGCISAGNDPAGGGGSGYCSLSTCKEALPYGISQKSPPGTSGKNTTSPPEAAVYIIEIKD